tara:strand:+ start:172 stop:411 length:240 start_codon:yes stop_codon:yes gene_type:complete
MKVKTPPAIKKKTTPKKKNTTKVNATKENINDQSEIQQSHFINIQSLRGKHISPNRSSVANDNPSNGTTASGFDCWCFE